MLTGTTITGTGVATGMVNGAGVATGADCGDGVAAGAATGAAVTSCDPVRRLRNRDLSEGIIAFVASDSHLDNRNACRHYDTHADITA